jgi:hypothetical protein
MFIAGTFRIRRFIADGTVEGASSGVSPDDPTVTP